MSKTLTRAARDVLAERQRQIEAEGWTPEYDDEHTRCELTRAALNYAEEARRQMVDPPGTKPSMTGPWGGAVAWPWKPKWWKPGTARRMLVKAAALLIAEIERLDRAEAKMDTAPAAGLHDSERIHLHPWLYMERDVLDDFAAMWERKHRVDPEGFPMEMDPDQWREEVENGFK